MEEKAFGGKRKVKEDMKRYYLRLKYIIHLVGFDLSIS